MLQAINRKAVVFTLYTLALLMLTRVFILLYFGAEQNPSTTELFNLFVMAFRFDIKLIATILIIFLYLPGLFFLFFRKSHFLRVERVLLFVLFLILSIFSFIEFGYYLFFGNAIDLLIFGIADDGTVAVISSIIGDWRLILLTFLSLVFLAVMSYLYYKKYRYTTVISNTTKLAKEYVKAIGIILLLALLARGTLDTFPLSRKIINTNDNAFLNTLVLNPFWHFYYAMRDRDENDFTLTSKKVLKIAKVKSIDELKERAGYTKDNPLKRVTPKNTLLEKKPPHVIFVLCEGWSIHPVLGQSKENNILGEFAKHMKQDYFYTGFFSNAYGTNPTIENLLLNSPIAGISQSRATKISFEYSAVLPFKSKGYSTHFLSGGSSAWRNHNQFWPRQGFDDYIGRSTLEKHFGVHSDNPWGIYDEYLFEYLKESMLAHNKEDKPSFTFVLTTNNHTPVRLPKNFKDPKFNLEKLGYAKDDMLHYNMLRAYHYQVNALGKFLTWLKSSPMKDDVIVVATGDHILKGYDDYFRPKMQYLKYAVSTYLYVPKMYDRLQNTPRDVAGSHEDLFPTLYELALSQASYYNFGVPIMYKKRESSFGWNLQNRFIFANGVVTPDMKMHIWDTSNNERRYVDVNTTALSRERAVRIEKNRNQRLLKKYLLIKEYEDER
jgi:phosphoglycerol transferase MdoB-like AlkP superfamily enzyme